MDKQNKDPINTVNTRFKYALLFGILILLGIIFLSDTIFALDPIQPSGSSNLPRILCNLTNELIEGNSYTITCSFNYSVYCFEYNSSMDCIDINPNNPNDLNEGIHNFTIYGIQNTSHEACLGTTVTSASVPTTAESLSLTFTANSVNRSTPCAYAVFVRTNLTGTVPYAQNGAYYEIEGTSQLVDKQTGLDVTVNVSEVNESEAGVGVPDITILLDRYIQFTADSVATDCRYRYLGQVGNANNTDAFNWSDATTGCLDVPLNPGVAPNNNLSCGNLFVESTSLPNIFIKQLLYDYDIKKAKYGFYCRASTGIMGRTALAFTIDTIPPNISTSATETLVSFKDKYDGVINTSGVVYSNSRDLDMYFDTNENGTCKYSVTNSPVNTHSYGNMPNTISSTPQLSHNISITPALGMYRYFYFGCKDIYGNADNVSEVQGYRDGNSIMFLLNEPSCAPLKINASNTPADNGKSITIQWNASDQDGAKEDFVTRYAVFRVNSTHPIATNLTQKQLFEASSSSIINIANVSARNLTGNSSYDYSIYDRTSSLQDDVNYYYYVVPYYFNDTAINSTDTVMYNIKYNMSCKAISGIANSTDEGVPGAVTNVTVDLAMNNIYGTSLKLLWNLSEDDPNAPASTNNSADVTTYTILRQIYGSASETMGIYDTINISSAGISFYYDNNVSPTQTYCYIITTTDLSGLSSNSSKLCIQPNSKPYFRNITITPNNPRTSNNLSCTTFITDIDGDDFSLNGNVTFNWRILHVETVETTFIEVPGACTPPVQGPFQNTNFSNYTTECIANLSSSHFNKADKVWCAATAFDGIEYARKNKTATNLNDIITRTLKYINNTEPYVTNVEIIPNNLTHPKGTSNLFCNYTFNDIDGDSENTSLTSFRWYINNEGLNDYVLLRDQVGQTLSNVFIDQNDLVICSAKTHDIDTSWLNNPLESLSFVNSSSALVKDNSIPQIINSSAAPYTTSTATFSDTVTLVGNDVEFSVEWIDVDANEQVQMFVCDEFSSSENQASDSFNTSTYFGDNTTNNPIYTVFYTNQTGKFVNKISIKPFKFERNNYFVYAADSLIESGDVDYNKTLTSFPALVTFYDQDISGTYTVGEPIVNDTNNNGFFDVGTDIILRGKAPPNHASLSDIDNSNQYYYDYNNDSKYNASEDYIYRREVSINPANSTVGDRRLEVFAEDSSEDYKNRDIDYTRPIYDMYVYEVDSPGAVVDFDTDILLSQDNNNWFVLGKYNHFNPQYNTQPWPNKYLAFVLCIDSDDDGTCDTKLNGKNDSVYVHALSAAPASGDIFKTRLHDGAISKLKYNPEILISYESTTTTGCLKTLYCNTTMGASAGNIETCLYTARDSDNDTQSYSVRVCDDEGACSVPRSGTFKINHIPTMKGVYIGSDSNTTAVGTDNNIMCMHLGAEDETIPRTDFILDADANRTIFADVRNYKDTRLSNGSELVAFANGLVKGGYNLTFDGTIYVEGVNSNDSTYEPNNDALVIDINKDGIYNSATDVVIYNPFNSLREGDYLNSSVGTYLSFFDADSDGNYTWDFTYPEDIIYNVNSSSSTFYNADVNYTFTWYVYPAGGSGWVEATNFSWYDNDFNDILTHGNTVPGDRWICEVTPTDQYGFGTAMNSSSVTIGSAGTNPTLAPTILAIWDDSNISSPTTIGEFLTISINYSDPDSTQVKAYVCNSSKIIRNSGCFEKEFNRSINTGSINTVETMTVVYKMEDIYNMSPTNYTVMLCDPEYHCSSPIWKTNSSQNLTFYANHIPKHTRDSPVIYPNDGDMWHYPNDFSTSNNLFCNISYTDSEDGCTTAAPCNNNTNTTFTWYRTRGITTQAMIAGFQGETGAVLSNSQTKINDTWICSAVITDSDGAQSLQKNSSPIIIGTYITADSTIPTIDNVTTDSNISNPKNIGDVITFTVNWYSPSSSRVNIAICDSNDTNPSGCLGETLIFTNTTVSPIQIPYPIKVSDLQSFTNSTPHTINYTVLVINTVGGGYTTYTDDVNITTDDFAVNARPTTSVPEIWNNGYLKCNYTATDNDDTATVPYISNYTTATENFSIIWSKEVSPGIWQDFTFPQTNDLVPISQVIEGETWVCEVTPHDGYVSGVARNSSQYQVGNTSPVIVNHKLLLGKNLIYKNSSAVYIEASSPVTLGDDIKVRVWWTDSDDASTTLYILNESNFTTANIITQITSANTPYLDVSFNSRNISNTTFNANLPEINDSFFFALADSESINVYTSASVPVHINRMPEVVGRVRVNTTATTLDCIATIQDNDTILDYNTTTVDYLWYVDEADGNGYIAHPEYDVRVIPLSIVNDGEKWMCQVTPCDNYVCGTSKNSSFNVSLNDTPEILDVDIYNTASSTLTQNNATNPMNKGGIITFTVTWDDADLYRQNGESIKLFICNSSISTKFGCNETAWCSTTLTNTTSDIVSCTYNTSNLNTTFYANNSIPFSAVIYDDSDNFSAYETGSFIVNLAPFINVTPNITPPSPLDINNLKCNYDQVWDNDTNTTYKAASNSVHYKWFLNRSNTVIDINYDGEIVSNVLTQELDRWLCQVIPTDNFTNGTALNSSWVVVGSNVSFNNTPKIISVTDNSDNTTPILVGNNVLFSIDWADAQQPSEYVEVFICNSTNITDTMHCFDKEFVYVNTSADPITVAYTVENTIYNDATSGVVNYYIKLCDDSGLCSAPLKSGNFSVNRKPNVSNVSVVAQITNLFCNYTYADYDNHINQSYITWYRHNTSAGYCGDGTIDFDYNEQCEVGDIGQSGGSDYSCTNGYFYTGGTLQCNTITCRHDTSLCTGGGGAYCGDGVYNNPTVEECDNNSFGTYNQCSDIGSFTGGTLNCNQDCTYDISQCTGGISSFCGNGVLEFHEECDFSGDNSDDNIVGAYTDCTELNNYLGGTLTCNPTTCTYDTSSCYKSANRYQILSYYDNNRTLPSTEYLTGDTILCEVTPYDGYHNGTSVLSQQFESINTTPIIDEVEELYIVASRTVKVNSSAPIEYGKNVTINISWDDLDSYTLAGEIVSIFVCNETESTYYGCPGKELCTIIDTSNRETSCSFNTTNLTIQNISGGNNITYHVYIYDDSLKSSYLNSTVYVNRLPYLTSYNISPPYPIASNNLNCTYTMVDPDNTTNATPAMNQTNAYFQWYYQRGPPIWQSFNNGGSEIVVNYFTQVGDLWKCQITYGDGVANATPINTTSVLIRSTAYNDSKANITEIILNSANNYLLDNPIYYDASYTVVTKPNRIVTKYDNTTNVGDYVNFTIYWEDVDQLTINNESVRVYVCNTTGRFIDNSGCLDKTLAFQEYTNQNPIQLQYLTEEEDQSNQTIEIYICDDTLTCSDPIKSFFYINHPPGNFTPDILSYVDNLGIEIFECDYDAAYQTQNASNDAYANESRILNDDILTADYIWYIDAGFGYTRYDVFGATIPASSVEKVICSVNITDVYNLSSGFLNSSELDTSLMPILWPISDIVYNSYYVINGTNSSTLIGYLPSLTDSNVSAKVYSGFRRPLGNTTNVIDTTSKLKGSTTVAVARPVNSSYILVNRITGITTKFANANYIDIPTHDLKYYERYNITSTPYLVQPNIYRIDIAPNLNTSISIGDTVTAYSGKYPYGWFNFSVEVYNGSNNLHLMTNNTGTLGPAKIVRVFYDISSPTVALTLDSPTKDFTPTINFNLSDDFYVNLTTLIVNVTNGTHHNYHFTSSTSYDTTSMTTPKNIRLGSNIVCIMTNMSFYQCTLITDINPITAANDSYDLTITVRDLLNKSGSNSASFRINTVDLPNPVSFAKPIQNSTNLTFGLLVNLQNFTEIEYAVGTAPYPDEGWNVTSSGNLNYSDQQGGLFDFPALTKFMDYNYNIYLDDSEAKVNSSDLLLYSTDNVTRNGSVLKRFRTSERTNCNTSVTFNNSCAIIWSTNATFENDTDTSLYNGTFSTASNGVQLYSLKTTTYKYFDANNDSYYSTGEPVFNTSSIADTYIINLTNQTIINSSIPVLTLHLTATSQNLAENTPYRVSVRYHNGSDASAWTSTNPILYKPGYESPAFNGPTSVKVYDKNSSHSEPTTLVDIAYDTDLQWNWTVSTPQNVDQGETILRYEYALGNEPKPFDGWKSVFGWRQTTNANIRSFALNSTDQQQLVTGNTYYLTVRALTSFGVYGENASSNGLVYDDQTPPDLTIVKVENDSLADPYYEVTVLTDPLQVTVMADENLSECGFSVFRTPFDRRYRITNECNSIPSDNQTYVTCNLTNMDGTDLEEGNHTFYISCLDINENANTAIGAHKTIGVNFSYQYDENPVVSTTWIMVKDSYSSTPINRSYVYKNGYLTCNYTATDADGDSTITHSATEYKWYHNNTELPSYEDGPTLNISKYDAERGDYFNCSVRVRDITNRPSNWSYSNNITVNNSAPSVITLREPNGVYLSATASLKWRYGTDLDEDDLTYTIIIMNKTTFDIDYTVVDDTKSTSKENNTYDYNLTNLTDGLYYWKIKTCDGSGYSNDCTNSSNIYWFVKDSTGPVINILTPDNNTRVGKSFTVIADVNDANEPNVNISNVWVNFTNVSISNMSLQADMILNGNGYYEFSVIGNLTNGTYNMTVYANDTLGNNYSSMKQIIVDTNHPILQIDYPKWKFREQYLNHTFTLNLRAYNASTINYTITQNRTSIRIQSNHKVYGSDRDHVFTDSVNVNSLADGRYDIFFYAKDDLGNIETKRSWFAIDKTPPSYGDANFTPSPIYNAATLTVRMEWSNNSLVPDDNQYGVKNVSFYYINTTNATAPTFDIASITITYVDDQTYIVATSPITITGDGDNKNYSYDIPSTAIIKNTYVHWLSCAWDYAGNKNCSQITRTSIQNRRPNVTALIEDINMTETSGNDTIRLNASLTDPDNEDVTYTAIVLPNGTLLYDPLNSSDRTTALQGNNSGLNTLFQNVSDGNATLVERAHSNLLTNPGLESSFIFNDTNGTVRKPAPINWTVKNDADYDNESYKANYTIYPTETAGVNVTAKHYYYQEVTGITAGEDYSLSQWMKPADNTTSTRGRLHINWYKTNGDFISSTLNLSDTSARPLLTNSWKRYSISTSAPTGATKARIYLDSDANNTWVYIDNVVFEEGDRPTYYSKTDHLIGYIKYPVIPSYNNLTKRPYLNESQGTLEISLMPLWNGNTTYERYLFDVSGSGSNYFYAKTDGAGNLVFKYSSKTISYNISDWLSDSKYRLAFTWNNNTNITMYINGSLVNSTNTSISVPTINSNIYLGTDKSITNHIDSVLDEFVIFDYQKDSAEIMKDYNTTPVGNKAVLNATLNTLVYIDVTDPITNNTPLITVPAAKKSLQPNREYDQRLQFFGSDGSNLIASNVINVHVLTNDNMFMNVTVINTSNAPAGITYFENAITPQTQDEEANNITYSYINHSILINDSTPFWINNSHISYSTIASSTVELSTIRNSTVNSSQISRSELHNATVDNNSIIVIGSKINDSTVNNSYVENSIVSFNSILLNNVTLINSTVTNQTSLAHVNISNVYIDPSTLVRVTGDTFWVIDSEVHNSYLNNALVQNVTDIINSNITNCTLQTTRHKNLTTGVNNLTSNITINDAILLGDSSRNNCRLASGTITIDSTGFTYNVASDALNAQPLISDIWNYTPNITILDQSGNNLNSTKDLVGNILKLYASIDDPNINSSMQDFVNVTWTLSGSGVTIYTINWLNQSNITLANVNTSITTANQTNLTINLEVVDRFGNYVETNISGVNYTYSITVPGCGDGTVDVGEACDDNDNTSGDGCSATCTVETGYSCTAASPSVCTAICGDGLVKGSEECDDGNALNTDACTNSCNDADCGDGYIWSGNEECDTNNFGGNTCSDYSNYNTGSLSCINSCQNISTSGCSKRNTGGGGGGGSGSGTPSYCSNGLKDSDKGEIGKDCGGSCQTCESLCYNGKKDGAEEGVDCGGVCTNDCSPLTAFTTHSSCYNGQKDYNEDGIDCGGVCSGACKDSSQQQATCNDKIKNQEEEGVDCGGPCNPCQAQQQILAKDYSWILWFIIIFVILVIFIIVGIVLIDKEHKRQRELETKELSLEEQIRKDEQAIETLRSGHTIADVSTAGLYAKQEVKSQGPISDSIINLEKYIIASLDSGLKPSKIKELLVQSGWDESVSEVVLHKIMLSGEKLEEVELFISKQITKGTPDDIIADKLTKAHWSKEIVDLIIADVHKISKNTGNIHSYITKKVNEGKSINEIHQILVSIGWNEHYIERILDKHIN